MRTGAELLDATRPFATENVARSWWSIVSTLAVIAAALAGTVLIPHWAGRLASSALLGLLWVRLFIVYHDHLHGALLRKSKPAKAIMWWFGIYILNPASIWRRSHNYHHKHNAKITGASIGSYPVMTVDQYAQAAPSLRRRYAATRHPLTIAAGYLTIFLYGMVFRSLATDPKRHWDSGFAIAFQLALIVGLAFVGWDVLLFSHLLPICIATSAGAYLFYAQHNFPGIQLRDRTEWDYVQAALTSSSFMKMSPLMHWLTGNIGYHHVHHLNARIPFYRLPEAMAAIPELQSPGTTSWHPRDVLACFRLKLWDPTQQRMVGFDGQ